MSRPIRNTEATRPLPRQGSALAPPSKARKVLISFISTDQDSYEFKKQDPVFMGSFGQTPDQQPTNRHEIWRPTVALAQLFGLAKGYDDLIFNDYYPDFPRSTSVSNFFVGITCKTRLAARGSCVYHHEKPCSEDLPPWKGVPDMR